MTFPAPTAPHSVTHRVRLSVACVWIVLTTSVFSLLGVGLFGVLRAVADATGAPLVAALAEAAHAEQRGSGSGYIDHVEWTEVAGLSSLRVYPSAAGRTASTHLAGPDEAWAQVLERAPDADRPGMREQFLCHWRFAEFAQPGKASWNLETWRPAVGTVTRIASRCNPGGREESC